VARRSRTRTLIAVVAAVVVLGAPAWLWWSSLLPSSYSVMDMGYVDLGGGPAPAASGDAMGAMAGTAHGGGRSVATLTDPSTGPADVRVTLLARKQTARLASGQEIDGYTLNGITPGPEIDAVEGQLIEVRLVNESVPDGVVLHWHGMDVPGAEDGTAGVTQDAVKPGGEFVYRFRADHAGTYWYHSHQVSHEQVVGGLFGALVIAPRTPATGAQALALVHLYDGRRTLDGLAGDVPFKAASGTPVRVRVVNTDNGPMRVWTTGTAFRLLAVDGREVNGPTPLRDTAVEVTAGGRADLEVVAPAAGSGLRVELGGNAAIVMGTPIPARPAPTTAVDLLTYGTPAPIGFDPAAATRRFEYAIGRRPGIVDGVPGLWWTINGHLFPDVPMFLVREGDIVTMHITNSSGDVHPMHLHGHHAVVLSRNGVPATGSPWWFDSLNVENGDSFDVAFVADNPGIWIDHCHQLSHAAQGLVAHLAYEGIDEPFLIGGNADNDPE
jgi:FtsP/CotA-like multicopper oxidase with cupredoxin domain